ncbi:hypothetical protein PZA11_004401 [Diplocarpon coronariae]
MCLNSKPSRSMTQPVLDATNGARRDVKKGKPFDPEDLSRRLAKHLAEQRFRAEKRREAMAIKTALLAQQNILSYHHVPKVAATQFQRTTTPDVMRSVHKLAQPAVKAHLELLSLHGSAHSRPSTTLQRTQAMDQAIRKKELLRNRNQFQGTHDMEEAAMTDAKRDLYKLPQRTFDPDFAHLIGLHKKGGPRPLSTGGVLCEEDLPHGITKSREQVKIINGKDRHDWAQRDEEFEVRKRDKASPFFKKMESDSMLISKRERALPEQDTGEHSSSTEDMEMGSLFARFRRHPSWQALMK